MDEQKTQQPPLSTFPKTELIGLILEQRHTIEQLKTQLNYANIKNTNAS